MSDKLKNMLVLLLAVGFVGATVYGINQHRQGGSGSQVELTSGEYKLSGNLSKTLKTETAKVDKDKVTMGHKNYFIVRGQNTGDTTIENTVVFQDLSTNTGAVFTVKEKDGKQEYYVVKKGKAATSPAFALEK